ncbi:MAG: amino acid ABC transporter permease, partial [Clostridiales bacterium]|nr:amino acid ABC transporter permease [Clostridiales bacterium]
LWATIQIAVLGLIIGTFVGTLIAVVKIVPAKSVIIKILNKVCDVYIALFRGTPLVVQLLIFYFALPYALSFKINKLVCAVITFGLNSGAYVSEIMRGGIMSVDGGQMDAGRALGLTFWATMLRIVIPQAVKNIIPTLGNEFISLVKETSVASFITVMDLTKVFQDYAGSSSDFFTFYIMLAVIYLAIVLLITLLIKLIERRLRRSDRS